MRIFYTASFSGKKQYQKMYDLVLKHLNNQDVEIISPEKGNYKDKEQLGLKWSKGEKELEHYEAIRRGIMWADGVIIEISNQDFILGHEASLAMQSKRPVLCLSVNEDYSDKVDNRYFYGAKYNQYNIKEVIENFVKTVSKELLSERFNFFLSTSQLEYLEKISKDSGLNKSEYLRKLLNDDRNVRVG